MNSALRRFEGRVFELLAARGHHEARLSHLHLTRNLDVSGTRTTELARRAAMTKQGMADIVAQCETLGLVTRAPDPSDGRAKIVIFTDLGLQWLDAFRHALEQADSEMREELGSHTVDTLAAALADYARSFDTLDGA
jgi:DNA-binding MarR family transcriptional regulator